VALINQDAVRFNAKCTDVLIRFNAKCTDLLILFRMATNLQLYRLLKQLGKVLVLLVTTVANKHNDRIANAIPMSDCTNIQTSLSYCVCGPVCIIVQSRPRYGSAVLLSLCTVGERTWIAQSV
jgi:hypothetical protein